MSANMNLGSIMDFSSITQAGSKQDPMLGSLGTFGGVSDPFANNPFLFSPEATSFAQAGFTGQSTGVPIFSGALNATGPSAIDMFKLLISILNTNDAALDQYPQVSDQGLQEEAKKISETAE